MTEAQRKFLKQWTWFDAAKCREFIAKGDADGAGAWAKSAVSDVLRADELKGLYE